MAKPAPWPKHSETTESAELTELFRVHCDFVWRALRYGGLSEIEAEDGVQEVFLIVSQKLERYQERGTMRAWLATIARHVATNMQRPGFRRLPLCRRHQLQRARRSRTRLLHRRAPPWHPSRRRASSPAGRAERHRIPEPPGRNRRRRR